jgi:hypothetical protein
MPRCRRWRYERQCSTSSFELLPAERPDAGREKRLVKKCLYCYEDGTLSLVDRSSFMRPIELHCFSE